MSKKGHQTFWETDENFVGKMQKFLGERLRKGRWKTWAKIGPPGYEVLDPLVNPIANLSRSCFMHMRWSVISAASDLRLILKLTTTIANTTVFLSNLDYCNSLFLNSTPLKQSVGSLSVTHFRRLLVERPGIDTFRNLKGHLATILDDWGIIVLFVVTGIPVWAGILATGLVCVFYTTLVSPTDIQEVHDSNRFQ